MTSSTQNNIIVPGGWHEGVIYWPPCSECGALELSGYLYNTPLGYQCSAKCGDLAMKKSSFLSIRHYKDCQTQKTFCDSDCDCNDLLVKEEVTSLNNVWIHPEEKAKKNKMQLEINQSWVDILLRAIPKGESSSSLSESIQHLYNRYKDQETENETLIKELNRLEGLKKSLEITVEDLQDDVMDLRHDIMSLESEKRDNEEVQENHKWLEGIGKMKEAYERLLIQIEEGQDKLMFTRNEVWMTVNGLNNCEKVLSKRKENKAI